MFDTDLFQLVLRSFVFGDNTLVTKLLDRSPSSAPIVLTLAKHIEKRLVNLQLVSLEPYATQLEWQNRNRPIGQVGSLFDKVHAPWEEESVSEAASTAVFKTLERLRREAREDVERMFVDLAVSFLAQRRAMKVLSVDVDFDHTVKGSLVVKYRDTPVHHIQGVDPQSLSDNGVGRFSVYVSPNTAFQFCSLHTSESNLVVSEVINNGWSPAENNDHSIEIMSDAVKDDAILEICRTAVQKAEADSSIDWIDCKRKIREAASPTYSKLALSFAKDPDAVNMKMKRGGFWTLLDGDTDAVEHLARLSCWSSLCLPFDVQDQMCRDYGFTMNEAGEQLLRYCDTVGFQFFALDTQKRPITLA